MGHIYLQKHILKTIWSQNNTPNWTKAHGFRTNKLGFLYSSLYGPSMLFKLSTHKMFTIFVWLWNHFMVWHLMENIQFWIQSYVVMSTPLIFQVHFSSLCGPKRSQIIFTFLFQNKSLIVTSLKQKKKGKYLQFLSAN